MFESIMSNNKIIVQSIFFGLAAGLFLLSLYFSVTTFISGWNFTQAQFFSFWFYLIALAAGFGTQVGLYAYLKKAIHRQNGAGKVLAASGTTSTLAMVSCCAHYLVNIAPLLGIAGALTVLAEYQLQFFWVSLAFNLAGILYIANKIVKFGKIYEIK